MMKSSPASPLEVSEAEFALQFLVVAFDAPSQLNDVDENRERRVLRQGREPVFRRLHVTLGPFDDKPFDGMWLHEFVIARRRPDTHGGEARRQGLVGAFTPLDVVPGLGGQADRKVFRRDGSMLGVVSQSRGLAPRPLQGLGGKGSSPGGQTDSVDCTPAA